MAHNTQIDIPEVSSSAQAARESRGLLRTEIGLGALAAGSVIGDIVYAVNENELEPGLTASAVIFGLYAAVAAVQRRFKPEDY